jgi:Tol biopolymer transport system component
MKSLKPFDRLAILVLGLLLALILLVIAGGERVGVSAVMTASDGRIGAWGPFGVRFDREMEAETVLSRFASDPPLDGRFVWEEETLWFWPDALLEPGQSIGFSIRAGAESRDGRRLLSSLDWEVTVRELSLVYLVLDGEGGDLWRYDFPSGDAVQLTDTGGEVVDFAPGPAGEQVLYNRRNSRGGMDLWLIGRGGGVGRMLLACGRDRCEQPAWSPNGQWAAYARLEYDSETGSHRPSRVWIVQTATGETDPLYRADEALGHSPSFSPDGLRLASYDSVHAAIRILELETSQESLIPRTLQGVGDWSPDGKAMVFTDVVPGVLEPEVLITIADLVDGSLQPAFESPMDGTDFSPPRWSPAGKWLAVALRPVNAEVSKALWLVKLESGEIFSVAGEPSATISAYRWDPWGERLVYQQLSLGGSDFSPSIWIWDWESQDSRRIIPEGARPQWLP